ncbi:class I SAM-dependent methyltransferase [Lysobacter korlensis]|uniref:Class I SAM-dependent methyltransferase n=1 Tax=Lysobacter korlensis TaxID=553636 RepID=A0ABV6RZD2_9GAMM
MTDTTDWDAEAAAFDGEPDHGLTQPSLRSAWIALLSGLLPAAPARVADMGCGTGTLTHLLAEQGHIVDGLELSEEMLSRARKKTKGLSGVRIIKGDANEPALEPGSYDVVLSRHVLWAMRNPPEALSRWRSLLRPGGRLVLVEGRWSTGAGLPSSATLEYLDALGMSARSHVLSSEDLWGRPIEDERYAVVAT